MLKCRLVKFCLVFVSLFVVLACSTSPDKKLVEQKCTQPGCHTTERVYKQRLSELQWKNTVMAMKSRGMKVTDEEVDRIVAYLSANYGVK